MNLVDSILFSSSLLIYSLDLMHVVAPAKYAKTLCHGKSYDVFSKIWLVFINNLHSMAVHSF